MALEGGTRMGLKLGSQKLVKEAVYNQILLSFWEETQFLKCMLPAPLTALCALMSPSTQMPRVP